MKPIALERLLLILGVFAAGFLSHLLYQRWTIPPKEAEGYSVMFAPLPAAAPQPAEIPSVAANEIAKIKTLAGTRARIHGRVFRVGHSEKSNTYFLNFGPSSTAFTGVIFASAVERFEKSKLAPKNYEGKEVELTGEIRDHPQYGLEMVLEDPKQIKVLN